jgi:WD40 repeat protein
VRLACLLVLACAVPANAQDTLMGGERATPDGALVRLGRPWLHAEGSLTALALSRDGRLVAAAGPEKVHVWSARTGAELRSYPLPAATALAFSPDGKVLGAINGERTASFFVLKDAQIVEEIADAQGALAWKPDGSAVLVGHAESATAYAWPGVKELLSLECPGGPRQVAFARTGLAALDQDGAVRIRRTDGPGATAYYPPAGLPAALDPAGRLRAHVARDGTIVLEELGSQATLVRLEGHPRSRVTTLSFAQADTLLASGDEEGTVKVWIPDGDAALPTATLHAHETAVGGVAVAGSVLATYARGAQEVKLFSSRSGELYRKGHTASVTALAYSPDGKWLASGGADGKVILWSTVDREPWLTLHVPAAHAADGEVQLRWRSWAVALAWAPDSKTLAVVTKEGSVHLLDPWAPRDARDRSVELWCADAASSTDGALSVAYLPAGDRIVLGMLKGALILRDAATGAQRGALEGGEGAARAVAVAPDGKHVAATNGVLAPANNGINVFDLATSTMKHVDLGEPIASVGFVDSGTLVASGPSGSLDVVDAARGACLRTVAASSPDEGSAAFAACAPDGRRLAYASGSSVVVRDLVRGAPWLVGDGHRGPVLALAWAPSSDELASGGEDGSVVVWNTGVKKR